jgi:flagellar biosynthesis anti-sigma factor FlgM
MQLMKIQSQNVVHLEAVKSQIQKQGELSKESAAAQDPAEKVSISPSAVNMKQFEAEVKDAPEVRMDLVNRIKAEIEAGTYQRPAEKVAEAMIQSSLVESLYRQ